MTDAPDQNEEPVTDDDESPRKTEKRRASRQPIEDDGDEHHAHFGEHQEHAEEGRRVITKIARGLGNDTRKVFRSLLDRNPVSAESADVLLDVVLRLVNRKEFLERLLRSEFMKNVREMQSEITEAVGIASQSDVVELKEQLDEVLIRLEKLQRTLDEIVVEVEDA